MEGKPASYPSRLADYLIGFFSRDGIKLPDAMELTIEELIFSKKVDSLRPIATEVGKAYRIDDAAGR